MKDFIFDLLKLGAVGFLFRIVKRNPILQQNFFKNSQFSFVLLLFVIVFIAIYNYFGMRLRLQFTLVKVSFIDYILLALIISVLTSKEWINGFRKRNKLDS